MADDAQIHTFPGKPAPFLALVENPVTPTREPAFRNFGGEVFCSTARVSPDLVTSLLALFQREAAITGDWTLHDDLCAARDDVSEPPMGAA